ncbi:acidic endochitinase-like [Coffea eugenioides]|uniref:acidic endochitinase-like n=1 Tax=Coffea eugenioides TaxID=49369 RepID=UPI000F60CF05|nr:acidic endochitinase-like [Coffea eugenioides]
MADRRLPEPKHPTVNFSRRTTEPLTSIDDAREVASSLWNSFIGGYSDSHPLGKAVLDGVEFHIHRGNPASLDDLARALLEYNILGKKQMYLAAAPQCPLPVHALDAVIRIQNWLS